MRFTGPSPRRPRVWRRNTRRSSSQAAARRADPLGGLIVGERQAHLVAAGQKQQEFLHLAGDDEVRPVADGGYRLTVRRLQCDAGWCVAKAQPGQQRQPTAQRLGQSVVEVPWLPTFLSAANVFVVDEHLAEVGNRIEEFERG